MAGKTTWPDHGGWFYLASSWKKGSVIKLASFHRTPQDQVDMTNIMAFYILEGPYIDATRDEILNQYGSMNAYLRDELLE